MFPRDVLDTMVDGVNKQITGDPFTYGELLCWIGLWVMMSTVAGFDGCFFTLSNYMTLTQFENILNNLTYITGFYPKFKNPSGLVLM